MRIPGPLTSALLAGLLASPAAAGPYPAADAYFEVRDRAQVIERAEQHLIQTQPAAFEGKLVEVHGVISAIIKADRTLISLTGPNGGTQVMLKGEGLPHPGVSLDVGAALRTLCRVVTLDGSSSGSLEVVVAVREAEASAFELARKKAEDEKKTREAAALRARSAPPRKTTSRGVSSNAPGRTVRGPRVYSPEQLIKVYSDAVRYFNRRIEVGTAKHIAQNILAYSLKYDLDARLVMAVIACESNFDPSAVSRAGAMGLGQLMPGTAGDLGVGNAFNIQQNLEGSTRLLSSHLRNMGADGRVKEEAVKLALACYNAGAGAVKKYQGIPPYRETQVYITRITRLYRQLCGVDR